MLAQSLDGGPCAGTCLVGPQLACRSPRYVDDMSLPKPQAGPGPLSDHVRKGRTYRSPLAATGALQVGDWVRDDLPDLVWPVLTLQALGTGAFARFVRWQAAVQKDLFDEAETDFVAGGVDGRLTSLQRLAARVPRAEHVVKARAEEHGLLPERVVAALASYPLRPAPWLVDRPVAPSGQDELDLLAAAVLAIQRDGHREAVIKCFPIWAAAEAGTLRTSPETIELLQSYPHDPGTRTRADSAVRAMWGAHKGLLLSEDENCFADATHWAKVFWGANSMTSRCIRRNDAGSATEGSQDDVAADDPAADPSTPQECAPTANAGDGSHLRGLAMDLYSSYVEALETSPARLYDREQQEVQAGLVGRAARGLIAVLGSPDLWCMEHGAHVIRCLVEVRVYLHWMSQQEPAIYREFQDYGAGKAKLYARILDEVPEDARRSDFREAIKDLERLSHNDEVLDHRVVDTRDSFAGGRSLREMAKDCGLLDLYRQTYGMASGVSHSEWWSIEAHAMERCLNVLHRGHLIASLALNRGGNVELAASWVDQLYALIRISLRLLGTDRTAVERAFGWLGDDTHAAAPQPAGADAAPEDRDGPG